MHTARTRPPGRTGDPTQEGHAHVSCTQGQTMRTRTSGASASSTNMDSDIEFGRMRGRPRESALEKATSVWA
eukprot:12879940-Prorocentrum_lima.AAC.1